MRRGLAPAALLMLAACSGEAPQPSEQADSNALEAAPVAETVPAVPPTTGLRADVSALSGAVSGLSTRLTDMGLVIDLPSDALFDYDKAELTPDAEAQLLKAAELIRGSPAGAIRVIGHTDDHGADAYNQTLSEARARTVADWFKGQVGVRTRAFEVSGAGETQPVSPYAKPDGGDDPVGRAKNRRVEVIVPSAAAG